jgi:hypothetical protein
MFFKLKYIIKPLDLGETNVFEFDINKKEYVIHFKLQKIPKEELKKGSVFGDISCTAITEHIISEKRQRFFESMSNDVPTGIQPLINEVTSELSDSIFQIISNIRWKWGLASLHNFVRLGDSLNWSYDGIEWKVVPNQIKLNLTADFPIKKLTSSEDLKSLQELITSNIIAPLGHELFSEAWAQRMVNRRSSLVIGIAAAESGFKEFVGKLLPQANWLIQNIQSPPLVKMLVEFLPELPVKLKIKDKILPPPEKILDTLKKGIAIRNKFVHGNYSPIEQDTLEEVLRAIRDLLYLLDIYSGFAWAEGKISSETTKGLIRDANKNI